MVYTIEETYVPVGYQLLGSFNFQLETDGTVTILTDPDTGSVAYEGKASSIIDITDAWSAKVKKADFGGDDLDGAKLELYDSEGSLLDSWTTDSKTEPDGHEIGDYMVYGETYVLKETSAPKGYKCVSDVTFVFNGVTNMFDLKSATDEAVYTKTTGTLTLKDHANSTVALTLGATKKVYYGTYRVKRYTFTLKQATGPVIVLPEALTATNGVKGKVEFEPITFTEPGVYTFSVSEVKGKVKKMSYDSTIYTVTVTVKMVNGKLVASADKTASDLTFINRYQATVPSTGYGDYNRTLPWYIGGGAMLMLLLLLLDERRNRKTRTH